MPSSTCKSKACIKRKLFKKNARQYFQEIFKIFVHQFPPSKEFYLYVPLFSGQPVTGLQIVERCVQMVSLIVCEKNEGTLGSSRFFPYNFSPALLLSKRLEQAIFREALLTDTLVSGQRYLRSVIFNSSSGANLTPYSGVMFGGVILTPKRSLKNSFLGVK